MKKIPSLTYYAMIGLCLAIVELQKKSRVLEDLIKELFPQGSNIANRLCDLAYDIDTTKDKLDMELKSLDVVVFDEPETKMKDG